MKPARLLQAGLVVATALIAVIAATPAGADPTPAAARLQAQIDAHLAAVPGGVQISPTEISYHGGAVVLSVAAAAPTIPGPDCAVNAYCLYDKINYGYPRLKLTNCGFLDLGMSPYYLNDWTESIHFNYSWGSITLYGHRSRPDHGDDLALFTMSPNNPYRSDTYPHRNVIDHVYRRC